MAKKPPDVGSFPLDRGEFTEVLLRGVLRDPGQFRPLGAAARARILERYELKRCTAELVKLFEDVAGQGR